MSDGIMLGKNNAPSAMFEILQSIARFATLKFNVDTDACWYLIIVYLLVSYLSHVAMSQV